MIEKFIKKYGVLHQKEHIKFEYSKNYLNYYEKFVKDGSFDKLSELRFKYLKNILLDFDNIDISKDNVSLLEIGFGTANFLKYINKNFKNIKLYGNDLIKEYIFDEMEFVEDYLNKEFDIVAMYDSLEHFEDIMFLKDLKTKYIVISVPNLPNYNEFYDLEKWHHFKPNEHLWYFNLDSLSNFMDSLGYKLIDSSYIESEIRKSKQYSNNILTAIFKR